MVWGQGGACKMGMRMVWVESIVAGWGLEGEEENGITRWRDYNQAAED